MRERGFFLTILLMAELCLAFTAGTFAEATVRRLMMAAALTLPLLLLPRAPEGTPRLRLLPKKRTAWLLLLFLPVFILLVSGLSVGWGWLAGQLDLSLSNSTPTGTLPMALLLDALLPAVCEEVFSRGGVYSVLRPLGRRVAVIASAAIFALMHASIAQIPYALVAGVCLALLYELGGLILPMIFHLASNVTSLLLLFDVAPLYVFLPLGVLALISLPVLWLSWRRLGCPRPEKEAPVPGAWRSLLLSPLLLWLALILSLTVL